MEELKGLEDRVRQADRLLNLYYEPGTYGDYLKKQLRFVQEIMFMLYNAPEEDVLSLLKQPKKNEIKD